MGARLQNQGSARARGTARAPVSTLGLSLAILLFVQTGCWREESGGEVNGDGATAVAGVDPRPSIVLVVIESLRSDVVTSYGADSSSPFPRDGRIATPHLDALAAEGTRHAWAFADSPDSVASHASIFTGLRVDQHGVGIFGNPTAPPSLGTVAEELSAAGYQTAGFVENPMVGPDFGLDQGFETFATPDATRVAENVAAHRAAATGFDILEHVRGWAAKRDPSRPYFLFVNLSDPHLPLGPAAHPEFLPEGTSDLRVHNILSDGALRNQICRKLPDPETLAILRGLYRSRVAEADAKLGKLLDLVRANGASPLAIVTADHGTHFGERKLLGHSFDVDHRALHVPLVVAGPGIPQRVSTTPVALHRIADSIRCAAGVIHACEAGLPTIDGAASEPIFSIDADDGALLPAAAAVDTGSLVGDTNHGRVHCDPDEPVFGRTVSLIRFPMKLSWRQGGSYRLYDLSWDPGERADQFARQRPAAEALRADLDAFVAENGLERLRRDAPKGSLRERARETFEAARKTVLASAHTEIDAVWFVQIVLQEREDAELAAWVENQIPLHENEPFHPIIAAKGPSKSQLGPDPGHGIARWGNYLLASVANPEARAMRWLSDYLALDASGYILTHQLTALLWAEALNRPIPESLRAKRSHLLARIAAEESRDPGFSDLWIERAALLTAFSKPDVAMLTHWTDRIVEHHLGGGDFGDGASAIEFDGQVLVADQKREHLRGLAMIVLAKYLED